jgi:hypothetical protein
VQRARGAGERTQDGDDQVMQWRAVLFKQLLAPTKLNHADMSLVLRKKKRSLKVGYASL